MRNAHDIVSGTWNLASYRMAQGRRTFGRCRIGAAVFGGIYPISRGGNRTDRCQRHRADYVAGSIVGLDLKATHGGTRARWGWDDLRGLQQRGHWRFASGGVYDRTTNEGCKFSRDNDRLFDGVGFHHDALPVARRVGHPRNRICRIDGNPLPRAWHLAWRAAVLVNFATKFQKIRCYSFIAARNIGATPRNYLRQLA